MTPGARRPGGAAALLAAALAMAGSGCGRPWSPDARLPPLSELVVGSSDLRPTLEEAGLDRARILEVARASARRAGFELDAGSRRGLRARVEVVGLGFLPPAGQAPRGEVIVEVILEPAWVQDGAALRRSGRAAIALEGPGRGESWRRALDAASGDALGALRLDLLARGEATAQLGAELGSGDARTRERAVRALAARGARGWARAIAPLAHDADAEVSTAAVDALVALRDPGTTLALIAAAQGSDSATIIRMIPILAEMGGPDVEGWLLVLAEAHEDPAVRRVASAARAGRIPAKMARP
jgi:hypothetical protein